MRTSGLGPKALREPSASSAFSALQIRCNVGAVHAPTLAAAATGEVATRNGRVPRREPMAGRRRRGGIILSSSAASWRGTSRDSSRGARSVMTTLSRRPNGKLCGSRRF